MSGAAPARAAPARLDLSQRHASRALRAPACRYFGEGRFVTEGGGGGVIKGGAVVSLPSQRLTSSDLILLLATAARGNPHPLLALDVSDNELDEEGVRLLESMISDGQLPGLEVVDLSDNAGVPESCKKGVFNAMKMTQGQVPSSDCFRLDCFRLRPIAMNMTQSQVTDRGLAPLSSPHAPSPRRRRAHTPPPSSI